MRLSQTLPLFIDYRRCIYSIMAHINFDASRICNNYKYHNNSIMHWNILKLPDGLYIKYCEINVVYRESKLWRRKIIIPYARHLRVKYKYQNMLSVTTDIRLSLLDVDPMYINTPKYISHTDNYFIINYTLRI